MNGIKFTLASARVNVGLSQKDAAKALGISNKTLCKWEKFQAFPGVDMLPKICELYGIPYDLINFTQASALSGTNKE